MSTAQSPQPEDTAPSPGAPGAPGAPGRPWTQPPDRAEWTRGILTGLTAGLVVWGVAALLSPEDGALRQLAAAALGAAATVAVSLLLARVREHHEQALRTGLAQHTDDIRRLVESRLAQQTLRSESCPTLDRIRTEGVPELAERFAKALSPGPPILQTFVRLEMQRVFAHTAALTSTSTECPGENHDWLLTLTHAAERSISAVSTSLDGEFWNSEPASRYLSAQRRAIEAHGVSVRRLFLAEDAQALDDRLLRLCDEQQAHRIEVRLAVMSELPPHLRRVNTQDFVVYDEKVSLEFDQDLSDLNVRTRLIARQDHVQDQMRRFREWWDAGMSVRELEQRVDDREDGAWTVDRT
ncbi:hypothetical protein [Streptomyces tuirus]